MPTFLLVFEAINRARHPAAPSNVHNKSLIIHITGVYFRVFAGRGFTEPAPSRETRSESATSTLLVVAGLFESFRLTRISHYVAHCNYRQIPKQSAPSWGVRCLGHLFLSRTWSFCASRPPVVSRRGASASPQPTGCHPSRHGIPPPTALLSTTACTHPVILRPS